LKPSAMIETINRIMRARGREPAPPSLRSARDRALQNQPAKAPGILDREILDELLEYMEVGERESFFNEFFEDAQGYIEGLRTIEGEQSLEKIRGEMHALSGAARTIGATRLAAYARRVEFMSGVDIRNTGSILRDELATLLDDSTAALRQAASLPAP
jgi:HPt (histidine-containing phosphotransfer) domain-containing protein